MPANYRTIFREMLFAQSAAAGTFADVAGRYAHIMGQAYQGVVITLAADALPKATPAHPIDRSNVPTASRPDFANIYRDLAGLPRFAMTGFLSRYDDLRGPRATVRD